MPRAVHLELDCRVVPSRVGGVLRPGSARLTQGFACEAFSLSFTFDVFSTHIRAARKHTALHVHKE